MNRLLRRAGLAALLVAGLAAPLPALAVDTGGDDSSTEASIPTLDEARADIDAERWNLAIAKLSAIVAADPDSADAFNLLGYSFRHAGNTKRAAQAYEHALSINPDHTGALEYQGELFVILGDLDKARANLDRLAQICGTTCEEYEDLAEAIGG